MHHQQYWPVIDMACWDGEAVSLSGLINVCFAIESQRSSNNSRNT